MDAEKVNKKNQVKDFISILEPRINQDGHNYKDINFIELVSYRNGVAHFEIGYWIKYLNCKPIYEKKAVHMTIENPDVDLEGYEFCHKCGGTMKVSRVGTPFCSRICWKSNF